MEKIQTTKEKDPKPRILISSCLAGEPTRYDAGKRDVKDEELAKLAEDGKAMLLCPEQEGGLPTPREPAEIEEGKTAEDVLNGNGRVLTKDGRDVTEEFVVGARKLLQICQDNDIETVVLKESSPSCGSENTYDGTFSGTKREGAGIATELLCQNGIKVYSENNFPREILDKQ
ncbi:MAG: DUF523 domain-containing protein [Parcubacteria group bacterium]